MAATDNIHVLHVLNSAHGGSAISTFQLIEALKVHGVSSSLICFNNATQDQQRAIGEKVEGRVLFIPLYWTNQRIRVKAWKRPLIELMSVYQTGHGHKFQPQIDAMIRKYSINVIHTSTLLNPEGAIAAKNNDLPHIWHARELVGPDKHYQFSDYKKWVGYVDANCDVIVANSKVTRENLLNYFSDDKIRYIPNGIRPEDFSIKQHTDNKRPFMVGMIGNVTSTLKNHEFFIAVATSLKSTNNIEFRIYGGLPEKGDPYLKRMIGLITASGMEDSIKFMGHRANVHEIIGELDVLFHPTGWESFGRIFIEAMAGGVPVIGLKNGGGLEMIEHGINGYLIDNGDVSGAAQFITDLIGSAGLRNQLGANGRNTVMQRYDLKLCAQRIFNLYKDVIASRSKTIAYER